MPRPSTYNRETADYVCEQLARGRSLKDICDNDEQAPSHETIRKWRRDNPDFDTQFLQARQDGVHVYVDEMREIENEIRNGRLDPAAARVILDTRKWIASKLNPRTYGDKIEATINAPGSFIGVLDALERRMKTIDSTATEEAEPEEIECKPKLVHSSD